MTYRQTIEWLFEQVPMFQNVGAGAYKPGLDGTLELSAAFGNPHQKLKCIHIAGTNGKGSTASNIAAVLTASGRRTALYTSPHLVDFRERMRIDGKMIPECEVVGFIDRFRRLCPDMEPSFFELTTIMAFDWFARSGVDYAVVECGLGGRLDSTNIITPVLSVITNISLDHTALLGSTAAEIAREKAGIIKGGVPVVIGHAESDVRGVFEDTAATMGSEIIFAQDAPAFSEVTMHDSYIEYTGTRWGTIRSCLTGDYQKENTATALTALAILDIDFTPEQVCHGLAHVDTLAGLRGRWNTLSENPKVVCDTGHNPGGWDYLAPRLQAIATGGKGHLRLVLGFVSDKDVEAIMLRLPHDATVYLAPPSVRRAMSAEDLESHARRCGIEPHMYPSVAEAYEAAKADAAPNDTIFVGGSTFVVADLLAYLA